MKFSWEQDMVENSDEFKNGCILQGDVLSGKPGNVREFDSHQGNVRDFTENQGIVRETSCQGKVA